MLNSYNILPSGNSEVGNCFTTSKAIDVVTVLFLKVFDWKISRWLFAIYFTIIYDILFSLILFIIYMNIMHILFFVVHVAG